MESGVEEKAMAAAKKQRSGGAMMVERESHKQYKGIRMRKWGKWVVEIREPNKRSRIWLGSYLTPIATARAYDTAVFYIRGPTARLNFPELLAGEEGVTATAGGADLSAASIRKKATEVGARVDALETALNHHRRHNHGHHQNRDEESNVKSEIDTAELKSFVERVDLNKLPDPEDSDAEWDRDSTLNRGRKKKSALPRQTREALSGSII